MGTIFSNALEKHSELLVRKRVPDNSSYPPHSLYERQLKDSLWMFRTLSDNGTFHGALISYVLVEPSPFVLWHEESRLRQGRLCQFL